MKPSMHVIAPNLDDDLAPIEISENGTAYVALFTSVDLLHNHIMSKVPSRFHTETFTLEYFTISKALLVHLKMEPFYNFNAVTPNHWILRAGISQNDSQFSEINRNHQDIPNCIIALTFAQLCKTTEWNSTVLDVILKLGDRLYKKSLVKWIKTSSNTMPNNLRLRLDQMDLPVFIRPFVVSVNDELVKQDAILKAQDMEPMETMKNCLLEFLSTSPENAGILSSKDYHVAIWQAEDGSMMFDPHDIGPNGIRKSTGFACLQRFLDHKHLVDVFFNNVKNLNGVAEYQLMKVSVVKNYFRETNEAGDCLRLETTDDNLSACSDYNLFTTSNDVRSIRAKEVKNIKWTKENVPMGICYAVATLCISRSLDPEFYTRDIIDKIILFGNDLKAECEDLCFADFDLCNQTPCPDEINWNFELNSVRTNIQMDIFRRGIISKNPCQTPNLMLAIEEFFNLYPVGVLVTPCFVVALWKECDEFFIFYSCPIDEVGRISSTSESAFPGLVVFPSVDELYQNIIANIDRQSYCKPFEMRFCNITMTDLCCATTESALECQMRTLVNEELIVPAVVAKVEHETSKDSATDAKKISSEKHQKLIELIKAKSYDAPGFIAFTCGSIICGRLSKESKQFNSIARKLHVRFSIRFVSSQILNFFMF
jgi:hypothetical protein